MIRLVVSVFLLGSLVACGGSNPSSPDVVNVPFSSTDLVVGTGAEATDGKTVAINYTLWLYSTAAAGHKGAQLQATAPGTPFGFVLSTGQVIQGVYQGVLGMKVGGKRELVIPPSLGYGATGSGPVPPNATIIFDIELVSVQ